MRAHIDERHAQLLGGRLNGDELLRREISALFSLLAGMFGSEKIVLKAGKLGALAGMRSKVLEEQVHALQKIIYEDPTIEKPELDALPRILDEIQEEIADLMARRAVEDRIEKKISEKMQERHEEYVREIKLQVLKEGGSPENPQTLKRYAQLEKMEQKKLARSALQYLRPRSLKEIVGQDRAINSLLAKLASPFPQHILLYGPPGTGKTTVARLVLEYAKQLESTPFAADAPFVEVDGSTLRWDPREVTNPLLGSVHDPIYQGARRDLAEGGVPEPKLGLVSEAHGGVLFIDEVGELDPLLQAKLLKVLEDKRVAFDSSYYDASDPGVPKYIRKLFQDGAPADFILIGATTRDPDDISPAFRSRCAEVYFEPLTPDAIVRIAKQAARRLRVRLDPAAAELIAEYTIEGRKAVGLLADAFGVALFQNEGKRPEKGFLVLESRHLEEVIQSNRLIPNVVNRSSDRAEVGKAFGLGVSGFLGSVLEIEAVAFPAKEPGKGAIRFNEAAGLMARDSVFNAASVIRRLTGTDIGAYDLHINVIGGGRVDGPSAGLAILLATLSAIDGRPLRQDVAVTGEVSLQGGIRPIGGVFEKIYGAKQAGMKKVILPFENAKDTSPSIKGIEVVFARTVEEVLGHVRAGDSNHQQAV
ncbi:MAG: Lon family ATP-dependent protease [Bacillota bacterium]